MVTSRLINNVENNGLDDAFIMTVTGTVIVKVVLLIKLEMSCAGFCYYFSL